MAKGIYAAGRCTNCGIEQTKENSYVYPRTGKFRAWCRKCESEKQQKRSKEKGYAKIYRKRHEAYRLTKQYAENSAIFLTTHRQRLALFEAAAAHEKRLIEAELQRIIDFEKEPQDEFEG